MFILGTILLVLGFMILRWSSNAQNQPFYGRPLIFNNAVAVIIITLLWLGLFLSGLIVFWQINPTVVFVIVGIYAVMWIIGYHAGSEKTKAKKVYKIYKQLKLFRPKATENEIFVEVAETYFHNLQWEERRIKIVIDSIFESKHKENKDIKDVASSILIFENPRDDFHGNDFKKVMEGYAKRRKILDEAYAEVLGAVTEVKEKPLLSENTIKWLRSVNLNPDEMSNEQLAVFHEIDNHGKSNWAVRSLYGIASVFLLLAVINFLTFDLGTVFLDLIISFVFWYIGYKIQLRRVSKKFYEASIVKFAQEQAE